MKIRKAIDSDKKEVLNFCKNTFDWGDYIDKVWDLWLIDPSGLLLVSEIYDEHDHNSYPIALSHISECPKKILWIEGIRVNKKYRNQVVASSLLNYMTNIGIKKGFREASAIVSKTNIPSQKMLLKNGFSKIWNINYYNIEINKSTEESNLSIHSRYGIQIKVPNLKDIESIIKYINRSLITKQSTIRYFNSWKFYELENSFESIFTLVNSNRLISFVDQFNIIKGISILNSTDEAEEHNSNRKKIIQIYHIDCIDDTDYSKIIEILIINHSNNPAVKNIQIFISSFIDISNLKYKDKIRYSEQFFLYNKKLDKINDQS